MKLSLEKAALAYKESIDVDFVDKIVAKITEQIIISAGKGAVSLSFNDRGILSENSESRTINFSKICRTSELVAVTRRLKEESFNVDFSRGVYVVSGWASYITGDYTF